MALNGENRVNFHVVQAVRGLTEPQFLLLSVVIFLKMRLLF